MTGGLLLGRRRRLLAGFTMGPDCRSTVVPTGPNAAVHHQSRRDAEQQTDPDKPGWQLGSRSLRDPRSGEHRPRDPGHSTHQSTAHQHLSADGFDFSNRHPARGRDALLESLAVLPAHLAGTLEP